MDTGFYLAGEGIYGTNDIPKFLVRDGFIYGRRGNTGYYISSEQIHGPDGKTKYFLRDGHIIGPDRTFPWAPHSDGSEPVGPGF